MFYFLFEYLENQFQLTGASLFQYISFRSSLAFIFSTETDKYLFALTEDGYVIAFNKLDGNILWSLNLSNSSIDKNKKGKKDHG